MHIAGGASAAPGGLKIEGARSSIRLGFLLQPAFESAGSATVDGMRNNFFLRRARLTSCVLDDVRATCINCGYEYSDEDHEDDEAGNEFMAGTQVDDEGNEIPQDPDEDDASQDSDDSDSSDSSGDSDSSDDSDGSDAADDDAEAKS